MLKPAMNELLANVDNRYLLVNLAAQRARDISEEAMAAEEKLSDKAVKLALDEIAAGTIHYCPGPKPKPEPEPELPSALDAALADLLNMDFSAEALAEDVEEDVDMDEEAPSDVEEDVED